MIAALVVVVAAFLNRFRGGGFGAEYLPGHPRFYVAPVVMVGVACLHGAKIGVLFGLLYLFWSLLPWGHWYAFGRQSADDRPLTLFERLVEWFSADPAVCYTIRNVVAFLPMVFMTPWALLAGPAQTGLYWIAWAVAPTLYAIPLAEMLTGALWGMLALVS